MERASIGGRANWAGAAFELRLGVEFCVYILMGDAAGLGPGAARRVQLQAPEVVDDLILEFETGSRWAIQAKAGQSVRVEWNPRRPFGKALCQLHDGATSGQIDLAPGSLDRLELAVDHRAHASVTGFGEWLAKARQHHDWDHFAAASTGPEQGWVQKLPALLETEPDDDLLAFLKKLYVRRRPSPDEWWSNLRGRLRGWGVPADGTPDRILDVFLARVAEIAPHAGQLDYDDLRRACEGLPGLPRPGVPSFRLFHGPTEDELYRALKMPPDRPSGFVGRPELAEALGSERGVLVAGRPGSGKSHALIKLALARPDWPVVVVAPHFRADDLSRLIAQLRRVHTPYQLLWDDVHDDPALFADAVSRLAGQGDGARGPRVRVLAAYRDQYERAVRERVTPDLCRRAGVQPEPLRLVAFDTGQATRMAGTVAELLDLTLDEAALQAFARHVREGDGGPLFALSTGKLLREEQERGRPIRAADVARLPEGLLETWRYLYERLADWPDGSCIQGLLGVLHFLHRIGCPLRARLAELLFTRTLEYRRGEFDAAARTLAREGWLRREENEFAAHDVTLEAVAGEEEEPDGFPRFVRFAREGVDGEERSLGLLRDALGRFFYRRIAFAERKDERRQAAETAVSFGAQAIKDFRAAHSPAHLAMSLNNASVFYSDLAGLEETRAGRVQLLQQALAAVEEAVRIRRDLGLQADLAGSLNNAARAYFGMIEAEEDEGIRVEWLRKALQAIQEAVDIFRAQGIISYLMVGLRNVVILHLELAEHTGELDRARVLALCQEGEALCGPMEDTERLAFFRRVRQQLEV